MTCLSEITQVTLYEAKVHCDPVDEIVSRNWAAASSSIVGRVSGYGYWQNYQFEGKSVSLDRNNSTFDCVLDQFGIALNLQEFHNAILMRGNRPRCDFKLPGHLLHRPALRQ